MYTNVREQTLEDFNSRKKSIDEKLKNLYGPLYGNRLLFQSALDAVVKKHDKSIEALIKEICEKRDAEGLEDWRGYYKRCLAVLDQKALDIIQANSHLIHDDESRDVLRDFLEGGFLFQSQLLVTNDWNSASRQKYSTEIWREGDKWDTKHDYDEMDWVADNNNYQFHDHEQLCIHVREMNRYLTSIRNKIDQASWKENNWTVQLSFV